MTSKAVCICMILSAVCLFTLQAVAQAAAQKSPAECQLSDDDYSVFTAVLEGLGNPEDPEEAWQGREMLVVDLTGAGKVEEGTLEGLGLPLQVEGRALGGDAQRL